MSLVARTTNIITKENARLYDCNYLVSLQECHLRREAGTLATPETLVVLDVARWLS
jgi:hypothetical protein